MERFSIINFVEINRWFVLNYAYIKCTQVIDLGRVRESCDLYSTRGRIYLINSGNQMFVCQSREFGELA